MARVFPEDQAVAHAFRGMPEGWQPRSCGAGTPVENNLMRMAALNAHRDSPLDAAWAVPPVANHETRLEADCCPATGRLRVSRLGADPDGNASRPVTKRLAIG